MDITRRNVLFAGGAVGLLAILTACSSAGSAGSDLDYWYYFSDGNQQKYFKKHFVDDYKGSVPVRLTVKSSDTIDRLTQTALAAGKGPALIVTPGPSQVDAYSGAGYLADLTKYADKYKWNEKFSKWALEASKVDGKLVTLPTSYESMAFYFNPAVIDKNKLTVPKTREEFENFCTEAKAKGMIPLAAGNADWKGANEWHLTVAFNHNAGPHAIYSALQGKTPWTDAVFVDSVELLASYFQRGWYGGGVDTYFTNQFPKVYKQLASGEAAGMISGTWEFSNLAPYFGKAAGNSAEWDWATLPSFRKGIPPVVWDLGIGQSTGVNAKAPNVAAAAEYLNFLTTNTKTIAASIEAMNFQPPPIQLTVADFTANADERTTRLYTELPKAQTIGYTTWTFFPQKTETYMINEFEKVLTKQLSAKDYCAGIQLRFAKELAAGQVPTAPEPAGLSS
ncbi:MAG: hypothetical protein JWM49_1137 [Microbacteriaceae bacterium]|nr:hypothetical protein [Microbacteriaceae bacterium]